MEWISRLKIKASQWFEESLGALWALESTKGELKKLKEPFAVSKSKPVAARERGDQRETYRRVDELYPQDKDKRGEVRGSVGSRKMAEPDQEGEPKKLKRKKK